MYFKSGDRVIAVKDGRDYPIGRTSCDVFTYKKEDTGVIIKLTNTIGGRGLVIEFDDGIIIPNCSIESFKKLNGPALTEDEINQARTWGVRKRS
jgi:hypothetical protein